MQNYLDFERDLAEIEGKAVEALVADLVESTEAPR